MKKVIFTIIFSVSFKVFAMNVPRFVRIIETKEGKVSLGYNGFSEIVLSRFNNNCIPDKTFGKEGYTTFKLSPDFVVQETAIGQDGDKILLAFLGQSGKGRLIFGIARFNSDGSLDNTFNNGKGYNFYTFPLLFSLQSGIIRVQRNVIFVQGKIFLAAEREIRNIILRLNGNNGALLKDEIMPVGFTISKEKES